MKKFKFGQFYRVTEVDAALAAKDAAFERLKAEIAKKNDAFTRTTDNLTNQLAEARRALAAHETPEGVAMLMERQGWKRGEILALLALLYCAADASRMNGERAVDLMRDAISKAEKAMPLAMTEAQAREEGA